ncbi:cobalt ECF transporter T component CbiQ [Hydrogenoanaerobacterium sp.]|uniref:cobalt ECF transporter T component CbiQ n=1 Tax=Hydrogenoanaerobacterium sp. TaxID=2953763 RepID=UPI00289BFB4F|nr:cobalt ECF transporter T component CbiQ [Hydrogenoanaerobacterium sp.]
MVTMDRLAYGSKIKDVSPAFKAGLAVSTLLCTLLVSENLFSAGVLALMTLLCIVISGLPLRRYLRMCAIPFWFLLLGVVTISVSFSAEPAGFVNLPVFGSYLVVTRAGVEQALNVFLKSMAGVSCLYFLYVSTPMSDLLGLLDRMHTPKLLTELMMMIYRFIFILLGMAEQMAVAQKARLGNMGYRASFRSLSVLASSVFVGAFQKSSRLYDAMESRGYDGDFAFTGELIRTTGRQKAMLAVYELALISAAIFTKLIAG